MAHASTLAALYHLSTWLTGKLGRLLTHQELVAQWKGRADGPSECGHCREVEIKAVWEGVALCAKCIRKTPGTKGGFEFEGLFLLSQVVADV